MFLSEEGKTTSVCNCFLYCTMWKIFMIPKEKNMLQRCGRFSLPSRCALSSITTADGLIDSFASSLSLSLSSSPSSVHTITTIPSFCNRNDNNNNNNSNRNRNRNRNTRQIIIINPIVPSKRPPRTRRPSWVFGKIPKPFSSPTVK